MVMGILHVGLSWSPVRLNAPGCSGRTTVVFVYFCVFNFLCVSVFVLVFFFFPALRCLNMFTCLLHWARKHWSCRAPFHLGPPLCGLRFTWALTFKRCLLSDMKYNRMPLVGFFFFCGVQNCHNSILRLHRCGVEFSKHASLIVLTYPGKATRTTSTRALAPKRNCNTRTRCLCLWQ